MKSEIELLEYIYQNARIGQETVGRILVIKSEKLDIDALIKETLNNYKKIVYSSKAMLTRRNKKVKDLTMGTKMAIYMSIKKSLAEDNSKSNIVNLIYESSLISNLQLNDYINDTKINSKTILNIANRFVDYEIENVSKYKKILDEN